MYDPNRNITLSSFKRWMDNFDFIFHTKTTQGNQEFSSASWAIKEDEHFSNFILPREPSDLTLKVIDNELTEIVGDRQSLFHVRYKYLQLLKSDANVCITFAIYVNRECVIFLLQTLTED